MINTEKNLAITWLILQKNIENIINNNYHINSIIRNTSEYLYLDKLIESIKDNTELMHNVLIDFEEKNQNENIVNNISQKINELSEQLRDQGLENFNFIYGWNNEEFKEKLIKNLAKDEYLEIQDNLKKGNKGEKIGMIIDNHKLLLALYLMRIKNIEDLYIIDFDVLLDIKKISNFYEEKKLPFQFCLLSISRDIRVSEGLIYFKNIPKIQEIITKLIKIKGELNFNLRNIKNKIISLSSEDLSIENINNNIENFDIENFHFYGSKVNDKHEKYILNIINDFMKFNKIISINKCFENYLQCNNEINEYFKQDLKDKSKNNIIEDLKNIVFNSINKDKIEKVGEQNIKTKINNVITSKLKNTSNENYLNDIIKTFNDESSEIDSMIEFIFFDARYLFDYFSLLVEKVEDISGLRNIMYFFDQNNKIYKNPSNRSYEEAQKDIVNEKIITRSITKTTSSQSKQPPHP